MLGVEQQTELAERGVTYVRALISAAEAAAIEDRMWAFFGKRGIARHDRTSWPPGGLMSGIQGLRDASAPFSNARMYAIVDQLLGTGAAGDICLMHPWMLHNIAKNCSDRPRLMFTQTFLRRGNTYYS